MSKHNNAGLGRALIKAHKKKKKFVLHDGMRHTSDLPDGRDFGRLNLKSVTEQTSIEDFLDTATLAEKDFVAEMSNIKIVDPKSDGILSEEEKITLSSLQEENREILCIPRRPHWDINRMTKQEIDANEKEAFLAWRRKIAEIQETKNINLTPFEKNLEIWRQLWRVIERSDVVVQIIDGRNPLLFRCPDLEKYVKEVDNEKMNILMLNKADFLSDFERKCWCDYFDKINMKIVFFSASSEIKRLSEKSEVSSSENVSERKETIDHESCSNLDDRENKNEDSLESATQSKRALEENCSVNLHNSPKILKCEELLQFFKQICSEKNAEGRSTIGLIGYPNVGKSSTVNALLEAKKVKISSTPGKTKHFQTFNLDKDLCLCDSPGLVFPNFVSNKAEMVVNGILPIDQLTEWNQPVTLVTNMIPRHILQNKYSILIPSPGEGRSPNASPTAEELLNAHGYNRGFMTKRGLPDNARSARYVLKDFVDGELLYCHAPPDMKQEDYHKFPEVKSKKFAIKEDARNKMPSENKHLLTETDRKFFSTIHTKGNSSNKEMASDGDGKPWKKHYNRNKKEKGRRVYKAYD